MTVDELRQLLLMWAGTIRSEWNDDGAFRQANEAIELIENLERTALRAKSQSEE